MTDYIFTDHATTAEHRRLQMIETALDPATFATLDPLPVPTGGACLEIGAGAGSVLAYLGDRVGQGGRVVGVDKNTTYVAHLNEPPYQIITTEITADRADAEPLVADRFDLAHARYVLIHNAHAAQMIEQLARWLRPGGYLVIEEPDFTCARQVGDGHGLHPVDHAVTALFTGMGLDPAYGLNLPAQVAAAGLELVDVSSRQHLCAGGHPLALMMGASAEALREGYTATGKVTNKQIDAYISRSNDPEVWAVYYATVTVVARLPNP